MGELGLSMPVFSTRIERDVNIIQRYVAWLTQDHLQTLRSRSGSHRCATRNTVQQIRWVARQNHSPRHTTLTSPATIKGCICILPNYPQQAAWGTAACTATTTGILLNVRHRAARMNWCSRYRDWTNNWYKVLLTETSCFCLWNDGYRRFQRHFPWQPISASVILPLTPS